jgi:hypothetical protein
MDKALVGHRSLSKILRLLYVDSSKESTKPMSPSRDGNQVVAKQHGNGPPSVFREYGMGVFRFVASILKERHREVAIPVTLRF